jgi:hypothetical protein
MRKQLTIIAAGLGLAVGGFGLFSVSASAMSASGVAAISEVNHVPDPVGLPVERVQYYPYGYPCVFPSADMAIMGPAITTMGACLRSQKRTARSLTASTVARSRCVMPARVRAARNCRPVTRLILR